MKSAEDAATSALEALAAANETGGGGGGGGRKKGKGGTKGSNSPLDGSSNMAGVEEVSGEVSAPHTHGHAPPMAFGRRVSNVDMGR